MTKLTREQLQVELEDLKQIAELPELYLENYFTELRNNVDKDIVSKKFDSKKPDELNEIWKELISKIDSFENECVKKREFNLEGNRKKLHSIEAILADDHQINRLNEIQEKIHSEKNDLLTNLFQNKTIAFLNVNNIIKASVNKRIENKLILITDEFVDYNLFGKRNGKYLDLTFIKLKLSKRTLISESFIVEKQLDLIHLRSLDLSGNNFTEIKENTFKSLHSLQSLDLKNNRLREIKENAFTSLFCLQSLDLKNNRLKEIKENAFNNLANLKKIDLSNNQLSEIKKNTFSGLNNLQYLYLRSNKFTEIDESILSGLDNLKYLCLKGDKLVINRNPINKNK